MDASTVTMARLSSLILSVALPLTGAFAQSPWPASPEPTFRMTLRGSEYQLFLEAASAAVQRYGGRIQHTAALISSGRNGVIEWQVQLTGDDTMNAWALYSAEQSARLICLPNFEQLDEPTRSLLKDVQSLTLKLDQAKNNPTWPLIEAQAVVGVRTPGSAAASPKDSPARYTLIAGGELVDVVSPSPAMIEPLVGKRAVVVAYAKAPGKVELVSARAVLENTLELVVMSQCPYGVRAADATIEHLRALTVTPSSPAGSTTIPGGTPPASADVAAPSGTPPRLSLRYLFYRKQEPGPGGKAKTTWWSLHGEAEVQESLIQMAIRDLYTDRFFEYVQHRARALESPWQAIASQAGLKPDEIQFIAGEVRDRRDAMIETEYAYVNGVLGVADGSPTFVWESSALKDIRKVPTFAALDLSKGSCGGPAGAQ